MNYILVSVLVIILAVSVVAKNAAKDPVDVESPTPTPTESIVESPTPTPIASTSSPTPSAAIKPTASASPSPKPEVTNDWVYPGSLTDSTDTITDWYKNKIESMGYNVKSFVKTSANDVVKNVLSAAKLGEEIKVQITKNPGDSVAKIEVTR
jgi:flagellar capping protein FliD